MVVPAFFFAQGALKKEKRLNGGSGAQDVHLYPKPLSSARQEKAATRQENVKKN
jgi:hypothetical protein